MLAFLTHHGGVRLRPPRPASATASSSSPAPTSASSPRPWRRPCATTCGGAAPPTSCRSCSRTIRRRARAPVWVAIYDPRGPVVAASRRPRAIRRPWPTPVVAAILRTRAARSRGGPATARPCATFGPCAGRRAARPPSRCARASPRPSCASARAVRESVVSRLLDARRVPAVHPRRRPLEHRAADAGADQGRARRGRAATSPSASTWRGRTRSGQLAEEFNRMAASLERAHRALLEAVRGAAQARARACSRRRSWSRSACSPPRSPTSSAPRSTSSPAGRRRSARALPADHPDRRHLEVIRRQTERITGIVRDLLDVHAAPRARAPARESLPDPARPRGRPARGAEPRQGRPHPARPRRRACRPCWATPTSSSRSSSTSSTNALDASPPGGIVRVTAGPEPRPAARGRPRRSARAGRAAAVVAIHVLDEGPGHRPPRPSRRSSSRSSRPSSRGSGTGLGLPIVEEIVRAHRGEVEIL